MKFEKKHFQSYVLHRVFLCAIVLFLSGILVIPGTACGNEKTDDLPEQGFKSMVEIYDTQVIRMQTLTVSLGQYLGNDRVITIIDYDEISSGKFRLEALGFSGQKTNIELLDSDLLTGTTLFRVPGIEQESAMIRDTGTLKDGEDVVILGWYGASGIGIILSGTICDNPDDTSLVFSVRIRHDDLPAAEWVPVSGATVTDMKGNVLGLVQPSRTTPVVTAIQEDLIITVVRIDRILQQFSSKSPEEAEHQIPLSSSQIKEAFKGFQSSLKTNESDTFAGLYVRHSPYYKFIVLFTRDGEETVKPYIPEGMESYVEVQTVTYSLDDLRSARKLVTTFLDDLGIKSDSGTSYMRNRVEFTILTSDWPAIETAVENGQFTIPDCVSINPADELSRPSTRPE